MSIPVFEENYASAAIDGARIAAVTASVLVSMDMRLDDRHRALILDKIQEARAWLDAARELLPVETTSVHVVSGGGIITG